jgi:tryptophanyl-tRNA synthetase
VTDDEKFLYKEEHDLEKYIEMGKSNIMDIIAFGFDPEKTFIFSDCEYIKYLYPNVLKVQKNITLNQMRGIFGFSESDNIGKYAFPPVQAVPCFSNTFPHIYGNKDDV